MLYQLSYSRPLDPATSRGPHYGRAVRPARAAAGPRARPEPLFNFLSEKHLEWGGEDSNLCRLAPADLQSAPIGQLGHLPNSRSSRTLACFEASVKTTLSNSRQIVSGGAHEGIQQVAPHMGQGMGCGVGHARGHLPPSSGCD